VNFTNVSSMATRGTTILGQVVSGSENASIPISLRL